MKVDRYCSKRERQWDEFCGVAGGVSLQTRSFLDYHGDRFEDFRGFGERGGFKFIFPANVVDSTVYSHAGSTFGGMICAEDYLSIADYYSSLLEFYRSEGITRVEVKYCPSVFTLRDDAQLYVLQCLSESVEVKIGSFIELDRPIKYHQKKRNSLNRAKKNDLRCSMLEVGAVSLFYDLIIDNLAERHDTSPVHSLNELLDLNGRLGNGSRFYGAFDAAGILVAGVWLIAYKAGIWHTQYISSGDEGRKSGAVDLLMDHIVCELVKEGCEILSFGVSNYPGEKRVNEGLFRFKSRFGAKSCVNPTFSITL